MEFGDVFSTVDLSPDVIPWKQQFSVQGLRVVSIAASQASSSAGVVTNGTRLSAPGGPTGNLRTDSDIIRWIAGASKFTGAEREIANETKAMKVLLGGDHLALLTRDGSLFTWGSGLEGQLGVSKLGTSATPLLIEPLQRYNVVDVALGAAHTLALTDDGSVYSWGRGHEGQTGLGLKRAPLAKHLDITPTPRYIAAFMKQPVARIACGHNYSMAVSRAGQLWSWGEGGCGQLGFPKVTSVNTPTLVSDGDGVSTWADVACGWAHTLAITRSGALYSWGLNCKGQLGLGDLRARGTPSKVSDPAIVSEYDAKLQSEGVGTESFPLDAGSGGPLDISGAGDSLADGSFDEESKLDIADGTLDGQQNEFSASLRKTMSIKSEALNKSIQETLSLPEGIPPPPPAPVPIAKWEFPSSEFKAVVIAAGKFHSAALTDDGVLYTWGGGEGGRLGHSYDDIALAVSNGHSEFRFVTPVVCPKRVNLPLLADRIVSDVGCTATSTIVFAPTILQGVLPSSGFASGGKRMQLTGVGLSTLSWIRKVGTQSPSSTGYSAPVETEDPSLVEEELGPGYAVIPDVYVKFTEIVTAGSGSGVPPSRGASRGQTPTVKYVRAYAKIPSDANPSEDGLKCLSPAFGTEADVYVEIVVGALDGTQSVIRGKSKYTFFAAPNLSTVSPNLMPLSLTKSVATLKIGGSGLFGTMLADKSARPIAEKLVATVNSILERRDEEEARALAKLEGTYVEEAAPPPVSSKTTPVKKGAKPEPPPPTVEPVPPPTVEPVPPPGVTLFTDNAVHPPAAPQFHDVRVKLSLLIDGKVKYTSPAVPAWYEGCYAEEKLAPLPAVDEASDEDKEEDDEENAKVDSAVKSTYSATVNCILPEIPLSDGLIASIAEGDGPTPAITIRVDVSPNGDDFLRCTEVIQSYLTLLDGVSPSIGPVSGGTVFTLSGRAIPNVTTAAVKLTVTTSTKPKPSSFTCIVPAVCQSSSSLVFTLPRLEAQPVPEAGMASSLRDPSLASGSVGSLTAQSCPPVLQSAAAVESPPAPLLPAGVFPIAVAVAFDGSTFEDAPIAFHAYSAKLGRMSPNCGVITGGSTVTLFPDEATAAVKGWYIHTEQPTVRVHNEQVDQVVPCTFDATANAVVFVMPPLQPSTASAEAVSSVDATEAVPPTLDVPKEVSVSLSFLPGQTLASTSPLVFHYYDPSALVVSSVLPATAPLGSKVTVAIAGWAAVDHKHLAVKVHAHGTDRVVSPVYEVIGDTGISLDLPTVADGWTAGDAYVSVTIDGQHWTPPNAPTAKIALTVPKKGK